MALTTVFSSGNIQADKRFEYAMAFLESGQSAEALELLSSIAELVPSWPVPAFEAGKIYMETGNTSEAIAFFEQALKLDPADRQGAKVKLQLLGAHTMEDSLPSGYVQSLFDEYAPRFDRHLIENLEYSVPFTLQKLLKDLAPLGHFARILDLGCGTGLATEGLAPYASWIEGVDISAGMLSEAEKKSIYHRLHHADLLDHLRGTDSKFDLILASDVFNYCGALDDILPAAARQLATGGLIAFCIQRQDDAGSLDFSLGEDHRFSHSPDYIARLLKQSGYRVLMQTDHVLRKDAGADVPGIIYICAYDGEPDEALHPGIFISRRDRDHA
ncbi:MAG: methyltransferase domain-containing protein [Alphaproteobacteria bacterium]|nr:methyltransferase domain-containing protein [Alphaproteobacteria bacterium]